MALIGEETLSFVAGIAAEAERLAEDVRQRMNADVAADPAELFEHVYAQPTAALERQRAALLAELEELQELEESAP